MEVTPPLLLLLAVITPEVGVFPSQLTDAFTYESINGILCVFHLLCK
jgi:hypothetical protein